ncbi:MAG TPA: macro domain-containing protein [Bryobacteraceae bacterium]|nr:macro domain-containing protein [Bryobacteraceae bacterium]
MQWTASNGKTLKLVVGDITRVPVDAMVNAANSALAGGGGVDGAMHRAGGPSIMQELDQIRPRIGRCATGSAVATAAGKLPARYVFHAVGPVYRDGQHGEPEQLAACHRKCFELAEERGVRTLSFPAISTGVYGYPLREAAAIAVGEAARHLERAGGTVSEVIFVLFDQAAYDVYAQAMLGSGSCPSEI